MPVVWFVAVRRAARLHAVVDWLLANPARCVLRLVALETLLAHSPPGLRRASGDGHKRTPCFCFISFLAPRYRLALRDLSHHCPRARVGGRCKASRNLCAISVSALLRRTNSVSSSRFIGSPFLIAGMKKAARFERLDNSTHLHYKSECVSKTSLSSSAHPAPQMSTTIGVAKRKAAAPIKARRLSY